MVSLVAVSHLSLPPRARASRRPRRPRSGARGVTELAKLVQFDSIQDALLKPYPFRFARPTPLADVAQQLSRELGLPVVLDLAALGRLDVKPEDAVKLELQGVRLKTGLKLLLDQVGLTYKVVAEDNLLILTDKQGSEDPIERVMAEIHELHRDIHDIQDALDEVRELTGLSGADGAHCASRPSSRRCPRTRMPSRKKAQRPSRRRGPSQARSRRDFRLPGRGPVCKSFAFRGAQQHAAREQDERRRGRRDRPLRKRLGQWAGARIEGKGASAPGEMPWPKAGTG